MQFTVSGTYEDDSPTGDLTSIVDYTVDQPTYATVAASGLLTALQDSQALTGRYVTVTAKIDDLTDTSNITIDEAWIGVGAADFAAAIPADTQPALRVFNEQNIYAAYCDNSNVKAYYYNGTTWSDISPSPMACDSNVALYVYDNGGAPLPYIAFSKTSGTSGVAIYRYDSNSWTLIKENVNSTNGAAYVSLVVANESGSPVPYVAFKDLATAGNKKAAVYTGTDFALFGTIKPLDSYDTEYVALDIYNNGSEITPYFAYRVNNMMGSYNYCFVKKWNGVDKWINADGSDTDSTPITTENDGVEYINIKVDSTGIPVVSYIADDNGLYVRKFNGSSWSALDTSDGNVATANRDVYASMNMALENDMPWVTYNATADGNKVAVQYFDGSSWAVYDSGSLTASASGVFAFDVYNGKPYIFYRNAGTGDGSMVVYD